MNSGNQSVNLIYIISFAILIIAARFVFPYGDEPDFIARTSELFGLRDTLLFNPYSIFGSIINIDDSIKHGGICIIKSSTLSFWSAIGDGCAQEWYKNLSRGFYNVVFLTPFLMLLCFGKREKSFISKESILISLTFPGVLYYLGLFTNEQFSLIMSMVSMCFISAGVFVTIILCALIFILDAGNAVVFTMVVGLYHSYRYLSRLLTLRKIIFISLLIVAVCFTLNTKALDFFNSLPIIGQKADAMSEQLDGSDYYAKYPLLLRPVITYMTFIYMSPAYIKSIPLYIFFIMFTIYSIRKSSAQHSNVDSPDLKIFLLAFFTSTLSLVYMFPTYSNAKYYIFAFPAITQYFINSVGANRVYLFYLIMTVFLFVNLLLYTL
ncbi:TPA: hypothetical protein MA142_000437 [Klebsiella pneumoniae]|nr:hypothetical protein [Klebsiella pneumoniae]